MGLPKSLDGIIFRPKPLNMGCTSYDYKIYSHSNFNFRTVTLIYIEGVIVKIKNKIKLSLGGVDDPKNCGEFGESG